VAAVDHGIDGLVHDLLNARAHVLDAARGECLDHQAAQPRMIRRVLLQHPVAHAAEDRLFHDLGTVAPHGTLDEVLSETLVAQNEADLRMPACEIGVVFGEMNRIGAAQPLVEWIGIANVFRRQRIEQRLGLRSLRMLAHRDLQS
jgi:hypothetical protein